MRKECDSVPETSKGDMELKLNKYSRELNEIKKKVKRKEEIQERFYNLNPLTRPYKKTTAERKELAKDRNKAFMQGVNKLEEASKVTEDTHQVALSIMGTMQDQRVQLQNASNKVQTVKGNTGISTKYVRGMERKETVYKGLLVFIIMLLFATIVSLLYIKFTKSR